MRDYVDSATEPLGKVQALLLDTKIETGVEDFSLSPTHQNGLSAEVDMVLP